MTKADLVGKTAAFACVPMAQVSRVLDAAFLQMAVALKTGESVGWPGFGQFRVVDRAARVGVNPQTKQKISIAAKKAVKFSAAQGLKDSVQARLL